MPVTVLSGDCRNVLPTIAAESAQCCMTSPPYWGLRDYGVEGQLGLERTPEEYVTALVGVFREVRRVLRDDGTLWLNLGDSYAGSWGNSGSRPELDGKTQKQRPKEAEYWNRGGWDERRERPASSYKLPGLKPKDLVGIPWRVAFALQADGWYLRSDIIWSKPNPMPESVRDRPTKSHEYMFLLTKSSRYYYDAEAIAEPSIDPESLRGYSRTVATDAIENSGDNGYDGHRTRMGIKRLKTSGQAYPTRNARSVWTIATQPYAEAHFATFPPALAERCIKAGTKLADTVLDPFAGAGTTGLVADRLGRSAMLIELNPAYCQLITNRITDDAPLFAQVR